MEVKLRSRCPRLWTPRTLGDVPSATRAALRTVVFLDELIDTMTTTLSFTRVYAIT